MLASASIRKQCKLMKTKLIIMLSFLGLMTFSFISYGQESHLLPDQNPRFAESVNKYSKMADSLTQFQGTTLQQTYKAYDWYEAREERRLLRRERRHQYAMALNYGNSWNYPYYRASPFFYPSIGYRTGNWWLGW